MHTPNPQTSTITTPHCVYTLLIFFLFLWLFPQASIAGFPHDQCASLRPSTRLNSSKQRGGLRMAANSPNRPSEEKSKANKQRFAATHRDAHWISVFFWVLSQGGIWCCGLVFAEWPHNNNNIQHHTFISLDSGARLQFLNVGQGLKNMKNP